MPARRVRPTLEEVAARSGASRATASRVLNGSLKVAPGTREAVMEAVRELGYVPNRAARSLVTQRTDSIAFVVPEAETRVFSDDAFFSTVMRGVGEELGRAGKQLVLMLAPNPESYERVERYVTGGHVDGVIIASMHGADSLPAALIRAGVPVVTSGRHLGGARVPCVDVDHRGAVREAVEYLIATGRTRIATIAGPQDMIAGVERLAGYLDGVGRDGYAPIVAQGDFTRASGVEAMQELLDRGERIDAVVAASDLMAVGAMKALRGRGLRVPDDIAVVGFDDTEIARYSAPPLTTIAQPLHDIGMALARQVMHLADGEDVDAELLLPTRLVIREST